MSVSIVRSCELYQHSKLYHTTFWYPSVEVPSTAKSTKRMELNSLQDIDWLTFAWCKGIKLLLHLVCSAVHECRPYLHGAQSQTHKKITVYFIILYFHKDSSHSLICVLVCYCGLVKRHCTQTCIIFKILLVLCNEMYFLVVLVFSGDNVIV